MGRHSASYLAAQQPDSGSTTLSAAAYVGRVGAVALALGVGAVLAGGAGIANAEGTTDGGAGDASSTETSSDAPSGGSDDTDAPSAAADAPKTQVGNGSPGSLTDLTDLVASIPRQITTVLTPTVLTPTALSPRTSSDASNTPLLRPRASATKNRTAAAVSTPQADAIQTSSVLDTPDTAILRPLADAIAPVAEPVRAALTTITTVTVPVADLLPIQDLTSAGSGGTDGIGTVVNQVLATIGVAPGSGSTGGLPLPPITELEGLLQLVRRELEQFTALVGPPAPPASSVTIPTNPVHSTSATVPAPTDEAATPYGDIGKWMLQDGKISNYGGLQKDGKTVLEAVNVIIVDPNSTSPEAAATKLNSAMSAGGFPAQFIHSTGFTGVIDDITYSQQPTTFLTGYSDNFFVFPNNHGRIFGPDPVETSSGYVWTGAFSTEEFVFDKIIPLHGYVSSDMARNALALGLIASGKATYGGMVPLNNAYNTADTTTGDHDGYAVVLILT